MRARRTTAAAVALACALGGCGATGHSTRATTASHPTTSVALPTTPVSGASVFRRDCAACHSLIGSEALHKQGGDLLGFRMSRSQLLSFTRVMPARRPLTNAELQAVVDYVLRAEQAHHP